MWQLRTLMAGNAAARKGTLWSNKSRCVQVTLLAATKKRTAPFRETALRTL
ncbi:hypothetical protein TSAR_007519 [Trichomalopsis sarcophagae]|uniref:Uncharacterized protein n=1 Tax=Trichomalopsis sarcophagae TaxID=543379 RepID=A0A232EN01_9HYME|nr:hypothetical protein TSAR_007519 [Trichomalopsis sarcophagae]